MPGKFTIYTEKNSGEKGQKTQKFNRENCQFLTQQKLRYSDCDVLEIKFKDVYFNKKYLLPILEALKVNQSVINVTFHQCTFSSSALALFNQTNFDPQKAYLSNVYKQVAAYCDQEAERLTTQHQKDQATMFVKYATAIRAIIGNELTTKAEQVVEPEVRQDKREDKPEDKLEDKTEQTKSNDSIQYHLDNAHDFCQRNLWRNAIHSFNNAGNLAKRIPEEDCMDVDWRIQLHCSVHLAEAFENLYCVLEEGKIADCANYALHCFYKISSPLTADIALATRAARFLFETGNETNIFIYRIIFNGTQKFSPDLTQYFTTIVQQLHYHLYKEERMRFITAVEFALQYYQSPVFPQSPIREYLQHSENKLQIENLLANLKKLNKFINDVSEANNNHFSFEMRMMERIEQLEEKIKTLEISHNQASIQTPKKIASESKSDSSNTLKKDNPSRYRLFTRKQPPRTVDTILTNKPYFS